MVNPVEYTFKITSTNCILLYVSLSDKMCEVCGNNVSMISDNISVFCFPIFDLVSSSINW